MTKNCKNLSFRAENLAVPEIIITEAAEIAANLAGKPAENDLDDLDDLEDLEELEEIQYETLAIPEYHPSRAKAK